MNSLTSDSVLKKDETAPVLAKKTDNSEGNFDIAVAQHRSFLMRIAVASTRNVDDAEDIVQEALMRAHRGIGKFRGDCPLRTWLARIVVRVSMNHRRNFVRMVKRWTLFSDLERHDSDGKTMPFDAQDRSHDFDHEAMLDVGRHIGKLPNEFRIPLLMLAVKGMTIPEIAAVLEIPEGTVKSRIFYGRKRLKKALKL